jgi:hypothetical protein
LPDDLKAMPAEEAGPVLIVGFELKIVVFTAHDII